MAKMLGRLSPVQFCHRACLSPGEIRSWKPRAKNQEKRETRDDILAQRAEWFDETMERLHTGTVYHGALPAYDAGEGYAESSYFGGQA